MAKIALKNRDSNRESIEDQISRFLENPLKDKELLDDCIRWLILDQAVQSAEEKDEGASEGLDQFDLEGYQSNLIVRLILKIAPHLSFENPRYSLEKTDNKDIKNSCMDKNQHWYHKRSTKTTPFHRAAKDGKSTIIKHIIEFGEEFCNKEICKDQPDRRSIAQYEGVSSSHELLLNILRQGDPESYYGDTALHLAALADDGNSRQTLEVLLQFDINIANDPDGTFADALSRGNIEVVDIFLGFTKLSERFITKENIIKAMSQIKNKNGTAAGNREKIVLSLIKHAPEDYTFPIDVLDKIIEYELNDIWKEMKPKIKSEDALGLLHLAVHHQNVGLVKEFLECYPESVKRQAAIPGPASDGKNHYPLWYNKRKGKQIRTEVITATIKFVDKMEDLTRIFQASRGAYSFRSLLYLCSSSTLTLPAPTLTR